MAAAPVRAEVFARPRNNVLEIASGKSESQTLGMDIVFKVKLVGKTSSSSAKPGDYVEMKVGEDVGVNVSVDKGPPQFVVIIKKDAPIFGEVVKTRHRMFPFQGGLLEITADHVDAVDGTSVPIYIAERIQRDKHTGDLPAFPAINKQYIKGRKNPSVAPIVTAGATAALAATKTDSTSTIVAFTLLSQQGVGDLLNGTDAELADGMVFDARITHGTPVNVTAPEVQKKAAPEVPK